MSFLHRVCLALTIFKKKKRKYMVLTKTREHKPFIQSQVAFTSKIMQPKQSGMISTARTKSRIAFNQGAVHA